MSPWQVNVFKLLDFCGFFLEKTKINSDVGTLTLQFILIVAASSVGEELFYRAAVQVCYWGLLKIYL